MEFKHEVKNDIDIFILKGNVNNLTSKDVLNEVQNAIDNSRNKFVFDLNDVTMMDSAGLGIIVLPIKNNCKLKVILDEQNKHVREMVDLLAVNFDKLGYFESVEKAVSSFEEAH